MDQLTDRPTTSVAPARRRGGPIVAVLLAFLAVGALLAGCGPDGKKDDSGAVTLPASFPKADVPIVDGNLIAAGERPQNGTTVFNVTVQAKPGGFDDAKKKLTDAGYLALGAGPEGGSQSAQFSGKGYIVTVSSVTDGAVPNAVFYLVSKA